MNRRFPIALAFGLFGLMATTYGQGKPRADQFPEVSQWKASKVSPAALAKQVDARLASLKWVEVEANTSASMPNRQGAGGMNVVSRIQDRKTFSIQYPRFSFKRREEIAKIRLRSDGAQTEMRSAVMKVPITRPAGQFELAKGVSPADWALQHPGYVFASALGQNALSALVRSAAAPRSGYTMKVEEKVFRRLNQPIKQYRLSVARTAAAAKQMGPMQISFIIDAKQLLPLTVASESNLKGREPLMVVNRLRWKVARKPFDAKEFQYRKS